MTTDVFEKFVSESTKLHMDTLAEQIRLSEDVNKYSVWILGLATAGIAVLTVRFETILNSTWVQCDYAMPSLVICGMLFWASIILGAAHQKLSIKERNCYRLLIAMFGAQRLIPFFKHPDYPKDNVPEDMHRRISDGELLNTGKLPKFNSTQGKVKKLNFRLLKIMNFQQALTGISYVLLFALSIPA
jgi:hypothetical protein